MDNEEKFMEAILNSMDDEEFESYMTALIECAELEEKERIVDYE